mmetsp:Transcript_35840/g.60660  ORF Transcript_35840/g.60660 Transcript_35840/m.60660 type:complete len:299 (+) Transcript_35840:138-1034(+)
MEEYKRKAAEKYRIRKEALRQNGDTSVEHEVKVESRNKPIEGNNLNGISADEQICTAKLPNDVPPDGQKRSTGVTEDIDIKTSVSKSQDGADFRLATSEQQKQILSRLQEAQDLMLKRDSTRNDSQSSKSFAPISKEMKTLMIKKRAELFQMAMKERSRRLAQFPKAPRLFTGAANYDLTWFRTTYEEEFDSDSDEMFYNKLENNGKRSVWSMIPDIKIDANFLSKLCKDPICAICLDILREKEEIKAIQCGHIFHKECCKPWFHKKDTCPLCRQCAWKDKNVALNAFEGERERIIPN